MGDAAADGTARAVRAADVAAVAALADKACELGRKGHVTRSIEVFDTALAAAQALGSADCLINASLLMEQAGMCLLLQQTPGIPKVDVDAEFKRAIHLLCTVIPTLERRKAAGTLLAGSCRPVEELYNSSRQSQRADGVNKGTAWQTPFLGYDTYMLAAFICVSSAVSVWRHCPRDAAEVLIAFIASAADVMALPRESRSALNSEVALVHALQCCIRDEAYLSGVPPIRRAMFAAWERLQRSGVLLERDLERLSAERAGLAAEATTAINERYATAVLRPCALDACGAREVHESQFKKCAACKGPVYCCKEHQTADWPAHKAACKAARKAATDGGAGPIGAG